MICAKDYQILIRLNSTMNLYSAEALKVSDVL